MDPDPYLGGIGDFPQLKKTLNERNENRYTVKGKKKKNQAVWWSRDAGRRSMWVLESASFQWTRIFVTPPLLRREDKGG
jgi:hypothetical protein